MANKKLFGPRPNAINEAGGAAYRLTPEQALAQYASTGCLNGTFYATADEQLANVLDLCTRVSDGRIAQTAIDCREQALMKDMPALLCAVLSARNTALLEAIFPRVIDNGRMLRTFVQIVRSGVAGRKSFGTAPKRIIRAWLENRSNFALFRDAVGKDPSLADVIRMVHPRPSSNDRAALYAYLIGCKYDAAALPWIVREYEAFKRGETKAVPDVPFQMLTSLALDAEAWKTIARNAGWQMTRMNLNTFARHGVFEDEELTMRIAMRLADRDAVKKARVFPYQLMVAYENAGYEVPDLARDALQDAMEIATENVPAIDGTVIVCPDVSGSMSSAITGQRQGATSEVRCIDVAALVTAAIVRKNARAIVLPFDTDVVELDLNPRDSIMTNAAKLASIGGGGTSCSAPLAKLNAEGAKGDLVILVSDNESWADPVAGRGTAMMKKWSAFKQRNPKAKLVCIDLQPNETTQAPQAEDVLNIGGFSDSVFEVIAKFANEKNEMN